jgi:hypothetical protein
VKNILLAIVILCPLGVGAQENKPFDAKVGLWESTVTTQIASLPAMPEEQIAALKGRGTLGGGRSTTSKFCVDRYSLNKPMYSSPDQSCSTKLVSSSPGAQQIHVECNGTAMKSVSDFKLERIDAEHTKGVMTTKSSGADGARSVELKITMTNRWVAADCGAVKPMGSER